jgi:hypothetical protein
MKEPLRLMAVERDVGRIQIEHDLVRHGGMRLDEQIAQQRVDLLRRVVDLVIALLPPGSSSRFSVLLPASGSSSLRLPLSTAISGS